MDYQLVVDSLSHSDHGNKQQQLHRQEDQEFLFELVKLNQRSEQSRVLMPFYTWPESFVKELKFMDLRLSTAQHKKPRLGLRNHQIYEF